MSLLTKRNGASVAAVALLAAALGYGTSTDSFLTPMTPQSVWAQEIAQDGKDAAPDYCADYAAFAARFVLPDYPADDPDLQRAWYANKKTCGRDLIKLTTVKFPKFDVPAPDAASTDWDAFVSDVMLRRDRITGLIFDENHGGTMIKKYYATDFEQDKIAALHAAVVEEKTAIETALDALSQDDVWKAARRAELELFFADFTRWMKPFCRASLDKLPPTETFAKEPDNFLVAADLIDFAIPYLPGDAKLVATLDGILAALDAPNALEIRVFHGRYEGDKLTPREEIFARYRARIEALKKRAVEERLAPRLVGAEVFNDRQTLLYEHGQLAKWGAKNPEQTDKFYIVYPKKGPATGRPLYVVLHSAGHSAKTALDCTLTVGNHDIYRVPDDFYGIFVDCWDNKSTDWWWGGRRADEAEITADNAERSGVEKQPVELRVLDSIAWAVETYGCDPNRVYLCGNSMGGSGTLGLGLSNGDVFAAIKANVPAGARHALDRLGVTQPEKYKDFKPVDPPVCVDYSAPNDQWAFGREELFDAASSRRYSLIAYWGNFGHENNDAKIAKINDLTNTFPWTEIRRNEAYPVFVDATSDNKSPWPECAADAPAGQRGAFFRWRNVADEAERFEIELRLTTAKELNSQIFEAPSESTADVSLRRLQRFEVKPGEKLRWTFGAQKGEIVADENGLPTIPRLTTTQTPTILKLERVK